MPKSFVLGVSVGESFAEYTLLANSKPVAQKRSYLLRENLKQSLQQFLSENSAHQPTTAFVSLRLPKKLLNYHLSGAVAHITTEGFEHWLQLCEKGERLTSKDLLFSIHERILADGTVEVPLKCEELDPIIAKMQLMSCKKVCLHFLHAATNPAHVQLAKSYLEEKGLQVFTPEPSDTPHESTRWKRNALNATISNVLEDRKNEVLKALEGIVTEEEIHFVTSEGKFFKKDVSQNIGSQFAASTALGLQLGSPIKADVLYLGFENFVLISSHTWAQTWESPWGKIAVPHLSTKELSIQPTLGIALNVFQRFDFSNTQEGWEPGPMFLGRGQKPCLLDLWSENAKLNKLQALEDRSSATGIQRFKNSLVAIAKTSSARDMDLGHLTKEMQSLTLQRLAMEACMLRQSEKMIVAGPLASVFANAFKKDPHTTVHGSEFSESEATALFGIKALQESV